MSDNTRTFHNENTFYVLGEFNDTMRDGLVHPLTERIATLASTKDAQIDLWIGSYGGDGHLCFHLVNLVEMAKAKGITVRTIVTSHAYSAGSILAVAGSPGHRYISPQAEHLIHYGSAGGWHAETPMQVDRQAEFTKRWFGTVAAHYNKHCAVPDLETHIRDDFMCIDAQRCIEWKLADKDFSEFT